MPDKAYVYVKDKDLGWVPAALKDQTADKAEVTVFEYADEQSTISDGGKSAKKKSDRTVKLADYSHGVLPLQNIDANGQMLKFSDMVLLPYLHEAGILYNLKERHREGHPYTRTGDIIIAVNPFQWFTELYTEKKRIYYSDRVVWEDTGDGKDPREGMEPHVYEVSALSYKGLAFGGTDQSILVSGESGAGKTETVKIAMNHMASVQKGPGTGGSDELDPVVKRVVESNPLLEAFGNAKTRRNDNSSRFGKYLQLQFDNSEAHLMSFGDKTESKCKLAGSKCDVYLLEKNRVTGHDKEERTYHIFYQILSAPDEEKTKYWDALKGTNLDSFAYVGDTDTKKIEGMTDAEHFAKTVDTLALINCTGDKLKSMLRAICAVLQLGNLGFDALGGDADKSQCTTSGELTKLAGLMNIAEDVLTLSFTERTMKTKTETYKVPLPPSAAKDAADACAREIYGKVFIWLVKEINTATRAEENYKDGSMDKFGIIGLLDIFGFESFVRNRFDQLCINYANEKLQQKFTEDIFRSVQEEYESEGIELAEIAYDDNTDVLDLIESRTGLLALLNEECVRPKGSDQDFVQKALSQNKKSPCLLVNKMDRMSFGIHHYAGKVMYDCDGFVENNKDMLPMDLSELCMKSDNFIISAKPEEDKPAAAAAKPGGRAAPKRQKSNLVAPTVWGKYKTQLGSLMTNLRKTNSRYIRCIKPNMKKVPIIMEHVPTMEQLRCAGVVAAVTLSRSAFPNRLENSVVKYRYTRMWDKSAYPAKGGGTDSPEDVKQTCDAILTCALKEKEVEEKGKVSKAFVVGKTRSYFRAGALEFLEANRLGDGLDGPATTIQARMRGFLVRKNWDSMVAGARDKDKAKKAAEEAARAEAEAAKAAEQAKKDAEAKKKKEEAEKKKREAEAKAAAEKAAAEERARVKAEEEAFAAEIDAIEKDIAKMKRTLADKKAEAERKIKNAEEEADEAEAEAGELKKKYDEIMKQAATVDQGEIEKNSKKIEESEKIVAYLRKENKKVRDNTEKMKEDLTDMKEQNNRLIEANASAGASLDSLEKQRKNLTAHNHKLADNLKKFKDQNGQLKSDLENRNAYFSAETKIRAMYEKAMEQVVELLEQRCKDAKLIEDVTAAQLQCEAIAAHKTGTISPGLISSDASD